MEEIAEIKPTAEYQKMFNSWQARQGDLQMDMEGFFTGESGGIERNDDGLPEGMDRLKAVGNAVNPFQAYPIFKGIMEIERGMAEYREGIAPEIKGRPEGRPIVGGRKWPRCCMGC